MTEPVSGSQCASMMTESQTPATTGSSMYQFILYQNKVALKASPKCIFNGMKRAYPYYDKTYQQKITPKKDCSPSK